MANVNGFMNSHLAVAADTYGAGWDVLRSLDNGHSGILTSPFRHFVPCPNAHFAGAYQHPQIPIAPLVTSAVSLFFRSRVGL